jgi:hypothetical protein
MKARQKAMEWLQLSRNGYCICALLLLEHMRSEGYASLCKTLCLPRVELT